MAQLFDKCLWPRLRLASGWCLLIFVSGCTVVGPDYVPLEPPLPESYLNTPVAEESTTLTELHRWWEQLGDPLLANLVRRGLETNLDLRAALARIDEVRAQMGVARGQWLPSVDASGSYQYGRQSENTGIGGTPLADMSNITVEDSDTYALSLGAAWEVDLFGRIRRSVEAAEASYEAAIEDYRGVRIVLCAEIATTYFDIRSLQRRIEIAKSNIGAQERSLELVRTRYDAGAAPALELAQAESNVASTQSTLPLLLDAQERALNRLSALLGEHPGSLRTLLDKTAHRAASPEGFSIGFPADLLRRRPDIRRTERLLAAQTARVGVATADLYPRLALFGTLGLASLDAPRLFDDGSLTYGIGPSLSWKIFDGGRVRSAIDVEDARVEQALVAYEKTILLALEEVEGALSAYRRAIDRNALLVRAVDAYRRSVELSQELYKGGETDFQKVLDAQRSLLAFEDQLAVSDVSLMKYLVALYRSLGGGWDWPGASGEVDR